jgi:hypothetical protein
MHFFMERFKSPRGLFLKHARDLCSVNSWGPFFLPESYVMAPTWFVLNCYVTYKFVCVGGYVTDIFLTDLNREL